MNTFLLKLFSKSVCWQFGKKVIFSNRLQGKYLFIYTFLLKQNIEKVYSNSLFNKNTKQNVRIIQLRNVVLTE